MCFFPAAIPPSGSWQTFHRLPATTNLQFYIINLEYRKQQEIVTVTWKGTYQLKRLSTCCKALGLYGRQKNPVLSGTKLLGNHLSYSRTVIKSVKLSDQLIPQVIESKASTLLDIRNPLAPQKAIMLQSCLTKLSLLLQIYVNICKNS